MSPLDAPAVAAGTAPAELLRLNVPAEAQGERLDRFLAVTLEVPRNQIQRWIDEGRVAVGNRAARASEALRAGVEIRWTPPPPASAGIDPEAGELRLLHEDAWLVAVDKPPGLAVHPGAGRSRGTLAHRLLERYPEIAGVGGPGRPGIVHRLDIGTSGVLVVARTPEAYRKLTRLFASRGVGKRYLAVVWGSPEPASDRIEAPIARHPVRRKEMAVVPRGKAAVTDYRTIARAGGLALLEVRIETGRTHQIRVHLRHRGWPLVGDPTYGEERWRTVRDPACRSALRAFSRPALHAWKLELMHPGNGSLLRLEAPPPDDLRDLWRAASGTTWPDLAAR